MRSYKGIRYARAERYGWPQMEPALTSLDGLKTAVKICLQNPSLHLVSNSIGQILFKRGDIRDFYNKPEVLIGVPEDGSVRQLTLW